MNALMTAGRVVGGLGLFLLAMSMITDGLKSAGAAQLRQILAGASRSRARGVASGFVITAVVQSSSAVTVAVIGFVNAGLMTLYQSLGVLVGANVGTTMTGWLVAAVGFDVPLESFALPLVGLGMLLRLTRPGRRLGSLGLALAGFGLFFVGLAVLRESLGTLTGNVAPVLTMGSDGWRVLAFVLAGAAFTILTQSSSAAIALILSAAAGGVLGVPSAAAMVIGANVGTTSTAVMATLGATPNARRVAAGHVVFNVLTGAIALALLPLLLWLVTGVGRLLGLPGSAPVILALFHTTFNLLGLALVWPLLPRLAAFLQRRFVTAEEDEARPRFLDRTAAATPGLGSSAVVMELGHLGELARTAGRLALAAGAGHARELRARSAAAMALAAAVTEFVPRHTGDGAAGEGGTWAPLMLRTARYFSEAAAAASSLGRDTQETGRWTEPAVAQLAAAAAGMLGRAAGDAPDFSPDACNAALAAVEPAYQEAKAALLKAGADGRLDLAGMVAELDWITRVRRLAQQAAKGARQLHRLRAALLPEAALAAPGPGAA
ncbi:MAG TPA: Na/Pi symporter [Gammaproteobacteria bacterium]|nr:Na/Pi symporter [Gammaproteobacteria bacterium]